MIGKNNVFFCLVASIFFTSGPWSGQIKASNAKNLTNYVKELREEALKKLNKKNKKNLPKATASSSQACVNFSGNWEGVCHDDLGEIGIELEIHQSKGDCSSVQIGWYSHEIGRGATHHYLTKTASMISTHYPRWNADRTKLRIENPMHHQVFNSRVTAEYQGLATEYLHFKEGKLIYQLELNITGLGPNTSVVSAALNCALEEKKK